MKYCITQLLCIALCGSLAMGHAFGQNTDTPTSGTFTFEEAVVQALERNLTLKRAQNNLQQLEADKLENSWRFSPQVSAGIEGVRTQGSQFIDQREEFLNITAYNFSSGINGSAVLFDGMGRINRYQAAKNNYQAQEFGVARQEQAVVFDVASQFLQVLLDQELLAQATADLENQETQLQQLRAQVEAGSRPLADQYQQEAEQERLRLVQQQAENALMLDKALLAQTLMLPPGAPLAVEAPAWNLEAVLQDGTSLEELHREALMHRADLKQQAHVVEAANYTLKAVKGGYLPRLSLSHAYYTFFNSSVFDQFTASEQLANNPQHQTRLSLDIPIFSAMANRANVARSQVSQANAALDEELARQQVYQQVQNAYLTLQAAKQEWRSARSLATSAQLAQETAQRRYDLGGGSLAQLAQANTSLQQAKAQEAQARYRLLFNRLMLDFQLGLTQPQGF